MAFSYPDPDNRQSDQTDNIVRLINGIFDRVYQRQAVFLYRDAAALDEAFDRLAPLQDDCIYRPEENEPGKREAVSRRLAYIVGENNLGTIEPGPYLYYGNVAIKRETCTLCSSCVKVCRAGALTIDQEHTVSCAAIRPCVQAADTALLSVWKSSASSLSLTGSPWLWITSEGGGLNPLIFLIFLNILFCHYETVYRNQMSALRS